MNMEKFITNNWIAIICVLAAIIVGLAVAWTIMDRKDKKLIAEYKAGVKAAKEEADKPVAEPVETEEAVEQPKKAPAKKAPASKSTTAKKPASKTAKK